MMGFICGMATMALIAMVAGVKLENEATDEIENLRQEIEYLRHYGNNPCTAVADEALKRDRAAGFKRLSDVR